MRIPKEQRRIPNNNIEDCICGAKISYVSWKWFKGSANIRHYAVICPNCRDNHYMWSNKIEKAVDRWNKHVKDINEILDIGIITKEDLLK